MDETPVIQLAEVTFGFPGKAELFSALDLSLPEGGYYLVVGPSGSGKSTLLRLMNRLEEPLSGTIRFRGDNLATLSPPDLRRRISLIQQTPTVVDASVRSNLLLPFGFHVNLGLDRPDEEILRERMDRFLLNNVSLDDNALELSVGQRQRLCFIRALILNPAVLLLDEPTASLDRESADIVEKAARDLNREQGLTVVNVSHRGTGRETEAMITLQVDRGTVVVARGE